jgi:hypothetical protein
VSDESPNPVEMTLDLRDRILDFSDEELLSRLKNFEDHFVERKSTGDSKDWLKTAVGFANSVPVGYPGVLFIGVKNSGEIEGTANLDTLQQKFSKVLDDAYPPIYYTTRIVSHDGRQCLAVIIPGSALRPHFGGHSYVREGSQTVKASAEQFDQFIAERSSKAYELLRWKGKAITDIDCIVRLHPNFEYDGLLTPEYMFPNTREDPFYRKLLTLKDRFPEELGEVVEYAWARA